MIHETRKICKNPGKSAIGRWFSRVLARAQR
jgi:hypothetical protein